MDNVVDFAAFRAKAAEKVVTPVIEVSEEVKVTTIPSDVIIKENGGTFFDYSVFMNRSWIYLVREVMKTVQEKGLPASSIIQVLFDSNHPGVKMPDHLRESFKGPILIVLDQWFKDLDVYEDHFSVTLNFKDVAENITVPFASITTFMDPSVGFVVNFFQEQSNVGAS